jgi:hypothetical protein
MAKINASGIKTDSNTRKRPGVQAKTKTSKHKRSKLYKKLYKGQGK